MIHLNLQVKLKQLIPYTHLKISHLSSDDLTSCIPDPKTVKFEPLKMNPISPPIVKLPQDIDRDSPLSLIYSYCFYLIQFGMGLSGTPMLMPINRELVDCGGHQECERTWHHTTFSEITFFIGIIIYMGVHKD